MLLIAGKYFALLNMKACLAKILLNFELLPSSQQQELKLISHFVMKSSNGINVKLKSRTLDFML